MPDTTLADLLNSMRPNGLSQTIVREIRKAHRAKEMEPTELPFHMVAVDGKCLWVGKHKAHRNCIKVTPKDGRSSYYMLRALRAIWVSGTVKLCLGQRFIAGIHSDMTSFPKFFKQLLKAYGRSQLLNVLNRPGFTGDSVS